MNTSEKRESGNEEKVEVDISTVKRYCLKDKTFLFHKGYLYFPIESKKPNKHHQRKYEMELYCCSEENCGVKMFVDNEDEENVSFHLQSKKHTHEKLEDIKFEDYVSIPHKKILVDLRNEIVGVKSRSWLPFLQDIDDDHSERIQIQKICATLQVWNHGFSDLQLIRWAGSGSFGVTFVCNLPSLTGNFVVKVLFPSGIPEGYSLLDRDAPDIPYHKNVVKIIFKNENTYVDSEIINKVKASLYVKKYFEDELYENGIIIMPYYPKDLHKYIEEREGSSSYMFSVKEVGHILLGILRGVCHLHKNSICHRDLHDRNIFVEDGSKNGRVWIGDFGLSLCFKMKDNFKLALNDCRLLVGSSGANELIGCDEIAPPEILQYKDMSNEDILQNGEMILLDFDKYDIYSVGCILENNLIKFCQKDDDSLEGVDFLNALGAKMTEQNPKTRISCHDALKVLENMYDRRFGEKENHSITNAMDQKQPIRREEERFADFTVNWKISSGNLDLKDHSSSYIHGTEMLNRFKVFQLFPSNEFKCFMVPFQRPACILSRVFQAEANFNIDFQIGYHMKYRHEGSSAGGCRVDVSFEFGVQGVPSKRSKEIRITRYIDKWYFNQEHEVPLFVGDKLIRLPVKDWGTCGEKNIWIDEAYDVSIRIRSPSENIVGIGGTRESIVSLFMKKKGESNYTLIGERELPSSYFYPGVIHRVKFSGRYHDRALRNYFQVFLLKLTNYSKWNYNMSEKIGCLPSSPDQEAKDEILKIKNQLRRKELGDFVLVRRRTKGNDDELIFEVKMKEKKFEIKEEEEEEIEGEGEGYIIENTHETGDLLIMKVYEYQSSEIDYKRIIKKKVPSYLPISRNICPVLSHFVGTLDPTLLNDVTVSKKDTNNIDSNYVFFVMPFYSQNLLEYLTDQNFTVSELDFLFILKDLVHAVQVMKSHWIVHRNISMKNICLFADSQEGKENKGRKFRCAITSFDYHLNIQIERSFEIVPTDALNFVTGGKDILYYPPEFHNLEIRNGVKFNYEKFDIFSVAVIAYTILSKNSFISRLGSSSSSFLEKVVDKGLKGFVNRKGLQDLVISKLIKSSGKERISEKSTLEILEGMISSVFVDERKMEHYKEITNQLEEKIGLIEKKLRKFLDEEGITLSDDDVKLLDGLVEYLKYQKKSIMVNKHTFSFIKKLLSSLSEKDPSCKKFYPTTHLLYLSVLVPRFRKIVLESDDGPFQLLVKLFPDSHNVTKRFILRFFCNLCYDVTNYENKEDEKYREGIIGMFKECILIIRDCLISNDKSKDHVPVKTICSKLLSNLVLMFPNSFQTEREFIEVVIIALETDHNEKVVFNLLLFLYRLVSSNTHASKMLEAIKSMDIKFGRIKSAIKKFKNETRVEESMKIIRCLESWLTGE